MTTTTVTPQRRRWAQQLHDTICARPDEDRSWPDRCACGHYRGRHGAFTHLAIATPTGTCTGTNLTGACLIPHCMCQRFSRTGLVYQTEGRHDHHQPH